MTKNIKQEKLLPSFKEIKEYASLYISLGLLILLCSSFVYNLGYFLLLDVKLLGVLTLGDYYEGTIPYIIIFCVISFFNYISYLRLSAQTLPITTAIPALIECFCVFSVVFVFFINVY